MTENQISNIFHDLKNDFATMTALVGLHNLYKEEITNEDLLNRLSLRQNVISAAYEKLYQNNNYPYINLSNCTDALLKKNKQFLLKYCKDVEIKKEVSDIELDIKTTIALTHILTELLSNSYMHAFNAMDNNSEIHFNIYKKSSIIRLEYNDNGKGFKDNYDYLNCKTLGMQFISSLSKQIAGKPEFKKSSFDTGVGFLLEVENK
ncbi:MAG: histidine kinase dimerization/phosphoacceptor domain -containing protein [Spirochaetales bacterium]|nr:histidine kinase dimerization/phosphoacceptor domain -containing protein [Spirochaetales bacterium]